ncbi:hypothetical protein E2562_013115 [Oryza meyeriana var. granulata]|uniref:Uncharacterized protein n=1 Tax=Oryza meyeriana var. granulata TaxID=110450 RepID=A0A6G1F7L5_9ORYZ|nr:hypothetical protein E2562_013115 [Oryza meyeriana var. granulata]
MSQLPPPLAAVADGGRKKRVGLPKLLHKFFFKVLRLRPASASAAEPGASAFEAYYGYRMVDEYYYYSYGGAGPASWAGVLSSIPEEESSEEGTPADAAATLRKAHSDSEQFVAAEAAVVHLQVVL